MKGLHFSSLINVPGHLGHFTDRLAFVIMSEFRSLNLPFKWLDKSKIKDCH
jgi:hypothetical protein